MSDNCVGIVTEDGTCLERLGASVRLTGISPIYDFYPEDILAILGSIAGVDVSESYQRNSILSSLQIAQILKYNKDETLYVLSQDGSRVLLNVAPAHELDGKEIIIEGGDVFIGNKEQFEDCFFSNPSIADIKGWCKGNCWKLEIK